MMKATLAVVFGLSLPACGQECLQPPCALPLAVAVDVTSTSGNGVTEAAVQVSGAVATTLPCDTSCRILGYAGTYTLTVSAPGYQSVERTVVVQGATARCGCASAKTEHVTVALAPSA